MLFLFDERTIDGFLLFEFLFEEGDRFDESVSLLSPLLFSFT